jgi:hypothetical protein
MHRFPFTAGGRHFEIRSAVVDGAWQAELFEAGPPARKLALVDGLIDNDSLVDMTPEMRAQAKSAIVDAMVHAVRNTLEHG